VPLQAQKMRMGAKGGATERRPTRFDLDSAHEPVLLAPLAASGLLPGRATQPCALGMIRQERVCAEIRDLGRNDQGGPRVGRGTFPSLAMHFALLSVRVQLTSHRSTRGEAVLPPRSLIPPWNPLPAVLRHVVASVRRFPGCCLFAASAPNDLPRWACPEDFAGARCGRTCSR
jgi:hypothetical protein